MDAGFGQTERDFELFAQIFITGMDGFGLQEQWSSLIATA
jgi:hypothetical protein